MTKKDISVGFLFLLALLSGLLAIGSILVSIWTVSWQYLATSIVLLVVSGLISLLGVFVEDEW